MTPPLHFVIDQPDSDMPRFLAIRSMADCLANEPEISAGIASRGDLCWSFQTYLHLAQSTDLPVSCGTRPRDDAINFVHSAHLASMAVGSSAFIVCLRADFPARRWAHHHIVQNRLQLTSDASYLPLWPQPGIIKRGAARSRVETAAYVGQTFNGNLAADPTVWAKAFASIGLEFRAPPTAAWNDFSEIDLLVGLRSFDRRSYSTKPPSKLINAWRAEAPFIAGYDSAYEQAGTQGSDFLRAETLQEALEAARRLKEDPAEYARIVQNGRVSAERFTDDVIRASWVSVIENEIEPRYRRWRSQSFYEKPRFYALQGLGQVEKRSRALARRAIDRARGAAGPR